MHICVEAVGFLQVFFLSTVHLFGRTSSLMEPEGHQLARLADQHFTRTVLSPAPGAPGMCCCAQLFTQVMATLTQYPMLEQQAQHTATCLVPQCLLLMRLS